ncbi:hypothetical protein IAR55_001299 [Kwoniella newhampshirensis]|uniref:Uncharacterized protein n=1 Tax=Kwoniella newhampshirensis TaxID=1651941 RepID=A0AAW0Z5H6_9TREE
MSDHDMSLTPITNPSAEATTSTSIQLSFSSGKGGAWDDRELINAANAAMKEFHTHHPGPGSWLDKATAAKAAGRPLPGGDDHDTAWYSAYNHKPEPQPSASTSQSQPPTKKRRTKGPKSTNGPSIPNPYAVATTQPKSQPRGEGRRAASPTYAPTSPRPGGVEEDAEGYYEVDENGEGYEDEDPNWGLSGAEEEDEYRVEDYTSPNGVEVSLTNGMGTGPGPSIATQAMGNTSRDEALGYAMTAQYWAGYWMGVAQARGEPSTAPPQAIVQPTVGAAARQGLAHGSDEIGRDGSNVFITKKQHGTINGLKR